MKERIQLAALGIVTLVLAVDNYKAGKRIENLRKDNEMLSLQNQAYRYAISGAVNKDLSVEAYAKELSDRLKFITIVANEQ